MNYVRSTSNRGVSKTPTGYVYNIIRPTANSAGSNFSTVDSGHNKLDLQNSALSSSDRSHNIITNVTVIPSNSQTRPHVPKLVGQRSLSSTRPDIKMSGSPAPKIITRTIGSKNTAGSSSSGASGSSQLSLSNPAVKRSAPGPSSAPLRQFYKREDSIISEPLPVFKVVRKTPQPSSNETPRKEVSFEDLLAASTSSNADEAEASSSQITDVVPVGPR